MYAPVGSFLGPCDTRISTRPLSSLPSPPSRGRGEGEGTVVGVTWTSHAKLRNTHRAWNDPFHRPRVPDLGSFCTKRSLCAGTGSVRNCDRPRSRRNASKWRHAWSYCIHALSCPIRTLPGVSSRCAHWHSHGTISPCRALFRSVGERSHADPFVGLGSGLHSLVWSRQRGDDRAGILRGDIPGDF